ncbi:unnamed protein product [Lasius platythorax]|uniref:Secreted protein n=1 Tax=Lasius platythorax TaxID=488582 RepID=A0AAV2MX56_9HYME
MYVKATWLMVTTQSGTVLLPGVSGTVRAQSVWSGGVMARPYGVTRWSGHVVVIISAVAASRALSSCGNGPRLIAVSRCPP